MLLESSDGYHFCFKNLIYGKQLEFVALLRGYLSLAFLPSSWLSVHIHHLCRAGCALGLVTAELSYHLNGTTRLSLYGWIEFLGTSLWEFWHSTCKACAEMSPCCAHDKNCLDHIFGLLDSDDISFQGVYTWCKSCHLLDFIKITHFANCFDIPSCLFFCLLNLYKVAIRNYLPFKQGK